MTGVTLDNISKRFGQTVALSEISLAIGGGELFFLLGPSGCGKSTLLRLIAGLHEPTGGRILFGDREVTDLGTEKRNAVMCFQSYALWPHMSVRDNIRFGLGVRNVPAAEQDRRIDEVLSLVQMSKYADRRPNQLSGGQQQRVALARALAVKPDCLLLDEPLSNLDAKLRHEMRSEIRRICKTAGFTTIYVTHDQKEALSVADRICLMKDGRIEQIGKPGEMYHRPASVFAADFIGSTNLIPAKLLQQQSDCAVLETALGVVTAAGQCPSPTPTLSIRPESIRMVGEAPAAGSNCFTGRALENVFLGESSEHTLEIAATKLKVVCAPPVLEPPGSFNVKFDPSDVVMLAR